MKKASGEKWNLSEWIELNLFETNALSIGVLPMQLICSSNVLRNPSNQDYFIVLDNSWWIFRNTYWNTLHRKKNSPNQRKLKREWIKNVVHSFSFPRFLYLLAFSLLNKRSSIHRQWANIATGIRKNENMNGFHRLNYTCTTSN